MRPIAPFAIALCLGLAGCQDDGGTTTAGPAGSLSETRSACALSGRATTVRYQTRHAAYREHAIQLLNGFDGGATPDHCTGAVPVPSVVTLRYRVAGS